MLISTVLSKANFELFLLFFFRLVKGCHFFGISHILTIFRNNNKIHIIFWRHKTSNESSAATSYSKSEGHTGRPQESNPEWGSIYTPGPKALYLPVHTQRSTSPEFENIRQ